MKKRTLLAAVVGVLVSVSAGQAHEKGFTLTIPQTSVAPKVDGNLDDAIWLAFKPVVWGNINIGGEVGKDEMSESWAAYDAKNLYIAFRNFSPNPADIVTVSAGHDSDVWMDEEIELFIEPAHAGAGPYYHVMINAKNVVADSQDGGGLAIAWESKLTSAAKIGAKEWTVEIVMPFEGLDQKAAPIGKTWGWNFNRHIFTKKADIWTGWAITGASFHTPARFGDLTFGNQTLAVDPGGKAVSTWAVLKNR